MQLNVGDWVYSYSAGIWQIYKILNYKCRDPLTGNETDKTTIFSKRFLNKSYKKSFSQETCDPSFIKFLSDKELKKLNDFILQNQKLYNQFTDYAPKTLDCIYNARIGIPKNHDVKEAESKIQKDLWMSDLKISSYLESLGFNTKEFPYWTVQFVSPNHQCKDGYLVFKYERILGK